MTKTAQLIKAVKDGTHRIDENLNVYRRAKCSSKCGMVQAGDWVLDSTGYRKDVRRKAFYQI